LAIVRGGTGVTFDLQAEQRMGSTSAWQGRPEDLHQARLVTLVLASVAGRF
jgi:hypothetical protein